MNKNRMAALAIERIDHFGFSVREFCQIFDLPQKEFCGWVDERSGLEPKREQFPKLAFALGISVQELEALEDPLMTLPKAKLAQLKLLSASLKVRKGTIDPEVLADALELASDAIGEMAELLAGHGLERPDEGKSR